MGDASENEKKLAQGADFQGVDKEFKGHDEGKVGEEIQGAENKDESVPKRSEGSQVGESRAAGAIKATAGFVKAAMGKIGKFGLFSVTAEPGNFLRKHLSKVVPDMIDETTDLKKGLSSRSKSLGVEFDEACSRHANSDLAIIKVPHLENSWIQAIAAKEQGLELKNPPGSKDFIRLQDCLSKLKAEGKIQGIKHDALEDGSGKSVLVVEVDIDLITLDDFKEMANAFGFDASGAKAIYERLKANAEIPVDPVIPVHREPKYQSGEEHSVTPDADEGRSEGDGVDGRLKSRDEIPVDPAIPVHRESRYQSGEERSGSVTSDDEGRSEGDDIDIDFGLGDPDADEGKDSKNSLELEEESPSAEKMEPYPGFSSHIKALLKSDKDRYMINFDNDDTENDLQSTHETHENIGRVLQDDGVVADDNKDLGASDDISAPSNTPGVDSEKGGHGV